MKAYLPCCLLREPALIATLGRKRQSPVSLPAPAGPRFPAQYPAAPRSWPGRSTLRTGRVEGSRWFQISLEPVLHPPNQRRTRSGQTLQTPPDGALSLITCAPHFEMISARRQRKRLLSPHGCLSAPLSPKRILLPNDEREGRLLRNVHSVGS